MPPKSSEKQSDQLPEPLYPLGVTAARLIEWLKNVPPDTPVFVEGGCHPASSVECVELDTVPPHRYGVVVYS